MLVKRLEVAGQKNRKVTNLVLMTKSALAQP